MPRLFGVLVLCVVFSTSHGTDPGMAQDLNQKREQNLKQLDEIETEIDLSEIRKQELAAEIDALEKDRATINRNLIEASTKARKLEQTIARNGQRLEELEGQSAKLRGSLQDRQGVLIEVLAALQRMGRKPPPALLVKPEDALSSVRSAILLGAVVPEVRAETEILLVELEALGRISSEIEAKRDANKLDLASLAEEDERLTQLLAKKKALASSARTALATETGRVAELAAKATSLTSLIQDIETEIKASRDAAEAAKLAEAKRKEDEAKRIASGRKLAVDPTFQDAGRISPAISFVSAKAKLPKPVNGVEVAGFGQKDGFGEITKGLSIATKSNARVISPADGWVIYAGPFRTYGQLLILNAGDGYRIVIAGMEKIDVQLGQFVLLGEPVGQMGATASNGNIISNASTRPILYVEFRKDETPIDPAPWWIDTSLEVASDDS